MGTSTFDGAIRCNICLTNWVMDFLFPNLVSILNLPEYLPALYLLY